LASLPDISPKHVSDILTPVGKRARIEDISGPEPVPLSPVPEFVDLGPPPFRVDTSEYTTPTSHVDYSDVDPILERLIDLSSHNTSAIPPLPIMDDVSLPSAANFSNYAMQAADLVSQKASDYWNAFRSYDDNIYAYGSTTFGKGINQYFRRPSYRRSFRRYRRRYPRRSFRRYGRRPYRRFRRSYRRRRY
jgi:hypothetical protein